MQFWICVYRVGSWGRIQGGPKNRTFPFAWCYIDIALWDLNQNFYNFWRTCTWVDSQQNNAYAVHSTYCLFLHYLVEIILSVFGAISRWNLLMNYVGKQLNSVNHSELYWSVYKQCLICTDERDMPVCRAISRGLRWLCGMSSWLQISSLTSYDLDVFGGSSRFWTAAARLPRRCTVQVNFLD